MPLHVNTWVEQLVKMKVGQVRRNESLAEFTTWHIGGLADVLVIPDSQEALVMVMKHLSVNAVPWTVIGRGSNVLVHDSGFRGAVIILDEAFRKMEFDHELDQVTAGAAVSLIKLSVTVGKNGFSGMEFAGGIPGTVGGAVYMNAGAHGSDISRILHSIEVVTPLGECKQLLSSEMEFCYRKSRLHQEKAVVMKATFQLKRGDQAQIASVMSTHRARRLRTQPLQQASAGSIFRNPPGDFAARLIEQAGLKGLRVGGAEVSDTHANFIVNADDASAEDVLNLMRLVQDKVEKASGVRLHPEVLVIGEG